MGPGAGPPGSCELDHSHSPPRLRAAGRRREPRELPSRFWTASKAGSSALGHQRTPEPPEGSRQKSEQRVSRENWALVGRGGGLSQPASSFHRCPSGAPQGLRGRGGRGWGGVYHTLGLGPPLPPPRRRIPSCQRTARTPPERSRQKSGWRARLSRQNRSEERKMPKSSGKGKGAPAPAAGGGRTAGKRKAAIKAEQSLAGGGQPRLRADRVVSNPPQPRSRSRPQPSFPTPRSPDRRAPQPPRAPGPEPFPRPAPISPAPRPGACAPPRTPPARAGRERITIARRGGGA